MKYMRYRPAIIIFMMPVIALLLLCNYSWGAAAVKGAAAPEFELKDTDGRIWRLSDLRGKVVFINFWSTWCPVCKDELPFKETLNEKMRGGRFQMIGILFRDDPGNLADYLKKNEVSSPTLISPGNEAAKKYGITVIPVTFIIDKKGIIRERIIGPKKWDSPEGMRLIEKWL